MGSFAKRTGVPVFSIDYRLAPKSAFPLGLDDVWQSYNWLINNSYHFFGILAFYFEQYFLINYLFIGIEAKNIIVSGDSAGGNLSVALTIECIKKGIRKPDGLFLMYPGSFL